MIKITEVATQKDNAVITIVFDDLTGTEHTVTKSFPIAQVLQATPAQIKNFILDKVALARASQAETDLKTKFEAFIDVNIEEGLP